MTEPVRAIDGRRSTIAAALAEAAARSEEEGRSDSGLWMLSAASLIAEDAGLPFVPANYHGLVRQILMPPRDRVLGNEYDVKVAVFSDDGTRIVTAAGEIAWIWDVASGVEVGCLSGHGGDVISAAFSPDGTRIVTASDDGTARIWDASSGAEIACLEGKDGYSAFPASAFSHDGARVVTAADGTCRIWDAANGMELAILQEHNDYIQSAAFNRDGTQLVTICGDCIPGTARIFDASTGMEIGRFESPESFVYRGSIYTGRHSGEFSPDGKRRLDWEYGQVTISDTETGAPVAYLHVDEARVNTAAFSPDRMEIVTGSMDEPARIWNAVPVVSLKGHADTLFNAAFSPDGKRVVTASDETARIFDATDGLELIQISGHANLIHSAAFSPDGTRIVTASWDGTARIWDAESSAEFACLSGHEGSVISAAFCPDGTRIVTASGDKTLRIWDPSSGAELACLRGHEELAYSAAFSPDGTRIVSASSDRTARIWDVASGVEVGCLSGHGGDVISAAFSPDGTRIVTASDDKTARIWDAVSGVEFICLGHDDWVKSAAFSPDGARIVTAANSGAHIWDAVSGTELTCLEGHQNDEHEAGNTEFTGAVFSSDGTRVMTVTMDNVARIWDVTALRQRYEPVHILTCGEDSVRAVAEAGGVLATGCGHEVQLLDVLSGNRLALLEGHDHLVRSLAFSADGSVLASASRDGSWRLWDRAGVSRLVKTDAHGGAGLWTAAFSPDGTRLLTSGADGTARIWDAATGDELSVLRGHEGEVFLAAFALGGTRVVTFGEDRTAGVWDTASGARLQTVAEEVTAVAVSPDGAVLSTGHGDGRTVLRSAADGAPSGTPDISPAGGVQTMAFSPDGAWLVTSCAEGAIWLTDRSGGVSRQLFPGGQIVSTRFSPDGQRIVCGHEDGTATVHDAASGRLVARLRGHRAALTDARYVLDGMRIVTVSDDHCAIIWEGGRVGGDWGSCLSYGQRRAIVRLGLAAAGISTDMPGDRIEGVDDDHGSQHDRRVHEQTVRAILRRAVAGS